MGKNYLSLVVPTKGLSANSVVSEVWGEATKQLLPYMGKLYTSFYPEVQIENRKAVNPYGVILGKNDPETFLELYAVAKIVQQAAMEYHLKPLIDQANSNPDLRTDDTLVCVINDNSSTEVQSHALWNLMLHEGVPLPDCGIYYIGLGSALVPPEKDLEIFRHLSDYAICVVVLEIEQVQP